MAGSFKILSRLTEMLDLQAMLDDIPCGAVLYNVQEEYLEIITRNEEYRKMFNFTHLTENGFSMEEMKEYLSGEDIDKIRDTIRRVTENNEIVKNDLRFARNDGSILWVDYRCKQMKINNEKVYLYTIFSDCTEQRNAILRMREQVVTDQLTSLFNKPATIDSITKCLENSNPLMKHALLVIDVDEFKSINDCYGHLFGDTVIQSIADKLRNTFRGSDIIGRFGGDEFIVFMKNIDIANAMEKAHEVCSTIHRVYGDDRGKVRVSCSVGMSIYPDDGSSYVDLFEHADSALYMVKSSGKGKVLRYNARMGLMSNDRSESEIMDYEDTDFENEDYDNQFVGYALKLLSSTENMRSSIDILLERIGQKFDLGVVALFEKTRAGHFLKATNYWVKDMSDIQGENIFEGIEMDVEGESDENGVTIVHDCLSSPFAVNFMPAVERLQMKSMLAFDFRGNALVPGKLLICDCAKQRDWTPYEMRTYYELSRMLAVFATLRMERTLRMNSLAINPPEKGSYVQYLDKLRGRRVLVVEDNKINAEIAKTVVEYGGMYAEIAENGRDALEMFLQTETGHYDVILMDIEMPIMNGYETTKRIRSCGRRDSKDIPIIAMTHLSTDKDVLKEFQTGMSAHVSKPLDIDLLYSVMGKTLA